MKFETKLLSLAIALAGCCSLIADDNKQPLYYSNFTNGNSSGKFTQFESQGKNKASFVAVKWEKAGGENGAGAIVCGPDIGRSLISFGGEKIAAVSASVIITFKPTAPVKTRATLFSYSECGWGQSYFGIYISPKQRIGVMFNVNIGENDKKIIRKFKLEGESLDLATNQFHKLQVNMQSGGTVQIFLDGKFYAGKEKDGMSFSDLPGIIGTGYPIAPLGSTYFNNVNNEEPFTGLISEIKITDYILNESGK